MTVPDPSRWHDAPPLPPVEVDPSSSGVEMRVRARRLPDGSWDAPAGRVRRDPGRDAWEPAAVVAWARPVGAAAWPWVLLVWHDAWGRVLPHERTIGTEWRWRTGWLEYDALRLEVDDRPLERTAYWRRQRSEAIAAAVSLLG